MKYVHAFAFLASVMLPGLLSSQTLDIKLVANVDLYYATARSNGRKIAVDKDGRICVCYKESGASVYFAYSTNGGTSWTNQAIASGLNNAYGYPAMALDTADKEVYIVTRPDKVWYEGDQTLHTFDDMADYFYEEGIVAPTISVNPYEGYGMFFAPDKGKHLIAQLFSLGTMTVPSGWEDLPDATFSWELPSSCWDGKNVMCAGSYYDGNPMALLRRVDYEPWKPHVTDYWSSDDNAKGYHHGYPSIADMGENVWAVYWAPENEPEPDSGRILWKSASPKSIPQYEFTPGSSSGSQIASGWFGGIANTMDNNKAVQVAEDYPFVVWERVTEEDSELRHKIWFTCVYHGAETAGWLTPQRVTDYGMNIHELDPHVAMDWKNGKVRIIWTQYEKYGDSTIINKKVMMRTINFGDVSLDLIIKRPSGGETWYTGFTQKIVWFRDQTVTPGKVEIWYNPGITGLSTKRIKTLTGSAAQTLEYNWVVGKDESGHIYGEDGGSEVKTSQAQVIVKLFETQQSSTPYATAYSNYFTMIPCIFVLKEPDQITSTMSSGSDNNPWDIEQGVPILGYIYPSDTFDIPWEGYTFSSLDTIILQFSTDGGLTYTNAVGGIAGDSAIADTSYNDSTKTDTTFFWQFFDTLAWVSPTAPTNGGYLRLMVVDTASDTFYSDAYGPYYIIAPGGNQYSTYSNQNIMSLNDDANKIGLAYTSTISGSANYNVVYMESDDGLDFSSPDTVDLGNSAGFSGGACAWKRAKATTAAPKDSLYYAYQTGGSFSTPYLLGSTPTVADSGLFAPVGILSENDTVHLIVKATRAYKIGGTNYSGINLVHLKFLESTPNNVLTSDTLIDSSTSGTTLYDPAPIAPTLVKNASTIYGAYTLKTGCAFSTITPSGFTGSNIGYGSYPHVGISEGNITYTYLGQGDTTLIRLWRYVDDTAWVERDTFKLDTVATFLTGDRGILFGVQYAGTGRAAHVYGYDPFSETFLRQGYYTGYYAHPYIDDESDEFSWVSAYADYADDSAYTFLHTIRRPLYVSIPAVYMESDTKRSPFTIVRDTSITYTDVAVDSARDSLVYRFPCLDDALDYSIMIEFYHEADSTTQLQLTIGSFVDTIEVSPEEFFWYHDSIPPSTDTVNLKIKRLSSSSYTFVPVSRIVIRRRSADGLYIMGPVAEEPERTKISFCLYQPSPNPFTNQATIRFALPYVTHASLKVYDVTGRLVTTLIDGKVDAGEHAIAWTGRDGLNRHCSSGVYFVRFTADKYIAAKKMVLIK